MCVSVCVFVCVCVYLPLILQNIYICIFGKTFVLHGSSLSKMGLYKKNGISCLCGLSMAMISSLHNISIYWKQKKNPLRSVCAWLCSGVIENKCAHNLLIQFRWSWECLAQVRKQQTTTTNINIRHSIFGHKSFVHEFTVHSWNLVLVHPIKHCPSEALVYSLPCFHMRILRPQIDPFIYLLTHPFNLYCNCLDFLLNAWLQHYR